MNEQIYTHINTCKIRFFIICFAYTGIAIAKYKLIEIEQQLKQLIECLWNTSLCNNGLIGYKKNKLRLVYIVNNDGFVIWFWIIFCHAQEQSRSSNEMRIL